MNDSLSDYEERLSLSRDLAKELGSLVIHLDKNVVDELELNVDGIDISIWSIYEAILAIHFLPDAKSNKIRHFARLIKAQFLNRYETLRRTLSSRIWEEIEWKAGNNIVFLGFTGYLGFENWELVLKNMIEDEIYTPVWVDDKKTDNFGLGNKRINIHEIVSDEILKNKSRIERDTVNLIQKLIKNVKSGDLSREKSDLLLAAIDFLRPQAEARMPKYLTAAIHILNRFKPSAIVSIDVADPRNRVFTLLANKLGVPVIQVQAGAINQECIEWSFCYDDLMLSHGPQIKPQLARLGFDTSRVVETGSAKLEKVINTSYGEEISLKSRFKMDESASVLLFLTSYTDLFDTQDGMSDQHRVYNEIYFSVVNEVSKRKNLSLVIKPHPLEKPHQIAQHNNIASKYENVFVGDASDRTSEMIVASDVVISFGSTATIDAVILGKPTICPKFENFLLNEYFNKSGAVLIPTNVAELSGILDVVMSGDMSQLEEVCAEGRRGFLANFSNLDSSASKAILSNIYSSISDFDSNSVNS